MEEREICCFGARGWTLVIGWLQMTMGTITLLVVGKSAVVVPVRIKMKSLNEMEHSRNVMSFEVMWVMLLMLAFLSVIMAGILLRGRDNKNPKHLNIWILHAKILLVIRGIVFFVEIFVIPAERAPWSILYFNIDVAIFVFCIWVVGIHKREIEASSGAEVADQA